MNGQSRAIRYLLMHGADVEARNDVSQHQTAIRECQLQVGNGSLTRGNDATSVIPMIVVTV